MADRWTVRRVPQFSSRRWRYGPLALAIGRHHRSRVAWILGSMAHAYLDAWSNTQFALATDGELELLRRLRHTALRTVIDVGANVGDWAVAVSALHPDAEVHCFEIDPETRHLLAARLGKDRRFRVAEHGLDSHDGEVSYHYYSDEPALTSLFRIPVGSDPTMRTALVRTGDSYLAGAGIARVDLLKIDVEGLEYRVLQGFAAALGCRTIRVVQFEYGLVNVEARVFLADLYDLLAGHGFHIGRLFPDGVEFRPYRLTDETFRGGNFVAVTDAEPALMESLRCR